MRTIKFKGKEIEGLQRLIIGDLFEDNGHYFIWHKVGKSVNPIEVDPETIGQFTGICDREGRELFGHDLVGLADAHEIGVISWNDKKARYEILTGKDEIDDAPFELTDDLNIYYIRNIHE